MLDGENEHISTTLPLPGARVPIHIMETSLSPPDGKVLLIPRSCVPAQSTQQLFLQPTGVPGDQDHPSRQSHCHAVGTEKGLDVHGCSWESGGGFPPLGKGAGHTGIQSLM